MKIAFQGVEGAYSHLACRRVYPDAQHIPCDDFQQALKSVVDGVADFAMIPLENSTAGRVEEIYRLIPRTDLHVIGEHFEPVNHCLLSLPSTDLQQIEWVSSHPQALAQCQNNIHAHGWRTLASVDTAGAAKLISQKKFNDSDFGAVVASELAAELYGLTVLKRHFEDSVGNTTRFLIFSQEPLKSETWSDESMITSIIFSVRNIPSALYKALGGFATNGVNMSKIESYMDGGTMAASHFHIDVDGHPGDKNMQNALDELSFFASSVRVIGVFPKHPYRFKATYV